MGANNTVPRHSSGSYSRERPSTPVCFNKIHSENVEILNDKKTAKRKESFCKGICFSDRPISVNERVNIMFFEISECWSGVLRIGFCNVNPATMDASQLPRYACPDLTSKPGFWAKALADRYAVAGNVVSFFYTRNGDVYYSVNGTDAGLLFTSVDTTLPVWALFDIYGNTTAIQFQAGETNKKSSHSSSRSSAHGPSPYSALISGGGVGGGPTTSASTISLMSERRPSNPGGIGLPSQSSGYDSQPSAGVGGASLDTRHNRHSIIGGVPTSRGAGANPFGGMQGQGVPFGSSGGATQSSAAGAYFPHPVVQYHKRNIFCHVPFHNATGKNVCLSRDKLVATRLLGEYCNAYVFLSRPLNVGEKVVVQILAIDNTFTGGLAFGVTSCDPVTVRKEEFPDDSHDLLDRPEYWVVNKDVAPKSVVGDELSFGLGEAGEVLYSKNGHYISTLMHVDRTLPLWPFFDVYGIAQKIRILGVDPIHSSTPAAGTTGAAAAATSLSQQSSSTLPVQGGAGVPSTTPSLVVDLTPLAQARPKRGLSLGGGGGGGGHPSLPPILKPPPPPVARSQQSAAAASVSGASSTAGGTTAATPTRPPVPPPRNISKPPATDALLLNNEQPNLPPPLLPTPHMSSSSDSLTSTPGPAQSGAPAVSPPTTGVTLRGGGGGGVGSGGLRSLPPPSLQHTPLVQSQPGPSMTALQSNLENELRESGGGGSSPTPASAAAAASSRLPPDQSMAALTIRGGPSTSTTTGQPPQTPLPASSATSSDSRISTTTAAGTGDAGSSGKSPAVAAPADIYSAAAAAARGDADGEGEESMESANECTVCFEREIDCVLYTCGHMCMCYSCALDIKREQIGGALCPICRQVIQDVIRTFRS